MSFVSATASNLSAVFITAARILLAAAALLVNAAATGYHVTAYVLSIVLAVVAWPLRAVYGVLFVVFSPIIYTVAYLLTPLFFFYNLVTSLQVSNDIKPERQTHAANTDMPYIYSPFTSTYARTTPRS